MTTALQVTGTPSTRRVFAPKGVSLDVAVNAAGTATFPAMTISGSSAALIFANLTDRRAVRQPVRKLKAIPAIPPVPATVDKTTYDFLSAMKNAAQVRFGQSKNDLDRSVTVRELVDLGVLDGKQTNLGGNLALDGILKDLVSEGGIPYNGGQDTIGELRDITGVEFSVNVTGVVITWGTVLGIDRNALAYTEIWRVGPFDLVEDEYPAMVIAVDGSGEPFVNWVDPANAVDTEGNALPAPKIALSGIAEGFIYGEPLQQGRAYQYFLRFRGIANDTTAWHSINGSRVEAVVDYQAILDAFESQISIVELDAYLTGRISRIDENTGELVTLQQALASESAARIAGIQNEADARVQALSEEVDERVLRIQDILDYLAASESATRTVLETRALIQDTEISRVETQQIDGDSALAAQIQTIIATSGGNWFVQPGEPTVDGAWTGTYHWVDTNDQNKHFVSTDDMRAAGDSGDNFGGWENVTDTRITANAAAVITEQQARINANNALASDLTNLTSQINNPTTGLAAVVNALDVFETYVEDTSANGFLANSSKFTNLQAQVNQSVTDITAGVNARQALEAYLSDDSENGFIQQTLFGTQLGADFADTLTGTLVTQAAFDALETYVNDQGPDGLLASSSKFTSLEQEVDSAVSGVSTATSAVNDLNIYLNDQGPGGFLQSATRFTNLEAQYNSLVTDASANADAINALDIYVRDDGPTGLLAQSQYLTQLEASVNANTGSVSNLSSALATEEQARVDQVTELQVALGDPNDPTSSAIYQEAASLVAAVDGRLAGRYFNALDLNGRITGLEFYDNNGNLQSAGSAFKIYTDNFIVQNSQTGQQPLRMTGSVFSLNLDVIELNGFVPSANIGTIDVDKITGNTANFVQANIGAATITSAMIDTVIQSTNYQPGGSGWMINRINGTAEFGNVTVRGNITANQIAANAVNIIDTLMLQGETVIVPRYDTGSFNRTLGSTRAVLCSEYISLGNVGNASRILVMAHASLYPSGGNLETIEMSVHVNGSVNTVVGQTVQTSGQSTAITGSFLVGSNWSGTVDVRLRCTTGSKSVNAVGGMFVMAAKK